MELIGRCARVSGKVESLYAPGYRLHAVPASIPNAGKHFQGTLLFPDPFFLFPHPSSLHPCNNPEQYQNSEN